MRALSGLAPRLHRPALVRRGLAAVAVLAALAVVAVSGLRLAERHYLTETEARGTNTLHLAVGVLRGHLARYEALPVVIAGFDDIAALLQTPDDPARVAEVNAALREINRQFGSSDIYLMGIDGTTIAASNFAAPVSFIGENFRYRPYFQDAMSDGQGRFYALGTTSLKRGYYFSARVMIDGVARGVVAVKVDIDMIEDTWRGSDVRIIVTDPEGITFMTSEPGWLYHGLLPLTPDRLARTAETRRYADAVLRELAFTDTPDPDFRLIRPAGSGEFLMLSETMPGADWTVSVLIDTRAARAQALTVVVVILLALVLGGLGAALLVQRRRALRTLLAVQREAQEFLERRVAARTAELASVNLLLEDEVAERRATEETLRRTQSDLVQAGKLAALGQMSTALSHEFNQPLAAAKNYADNALILIDRGRIEDAAGNIRRILGLVDRMTSLSRHLRNFARKPGQKLEPVDLAQVVADTLEIIDWRLRQGFSVAVDLGRAPLTVVAGPVRLQQVLVNILTNAMDAVEDGPDHRIALTARQTSDRVTISIRDHGPGIAPSLAERIFDPFFTTKGVGRGLGLGLSISYNIIKDFGGELRAMTHPDGGAVFTVELRGAQAAARLDAAE